MPDRPPQPPIFRQEALGQLELDEAQDEPLRVAPPWTWALFWLLAVLVVATGIIAFLGKVEVSRSGQGALRPAWGPRLLQTEVAGTLTELHAAAGEPITAGDPVARLEVLQPRGASPGVPRNLGLLRAPFNGYLEAVVVRPGDLIQAGQTLARLVPDGSPMEAVVFLPFRDRGSVKVGDRVRMALEAFPVAEYGSLEGRIRRIGMAPASAKEIKEVLGEDARLEGQPCQVEIELLPDGARRRDLLLHPGMRLQARFVVRRERIITLVLKPLRRWLG